MKAGTVAPMSFLLAYPIVLTWAHTTVAARLPREVESFRRMSAVVDYLLALKHGIANDTRLLHDLIRSHFDQHVHMYGDAHLTPKWHASLHSPAQTQRDGGIVLDTFCNERAHQVAKRRWGVQERQP